MKTAKSIFKLFRWIISILIVLFALSTFMWKNYDQTLVLILISTLLIYWPKSIKKSLTAIQSDGLRIALIILLILLKVSVFKSEPKSSIYTSEANKAEVMAAYDENMKRWPKDTKDIYIDTEFGSVHVLECGKKENPPLVMLHAASMGAHSWAENLPPLLDNYHIFSIDNPGEGNKSELGNVLLFPSSPEEIAGFYASLFDSLSIETAIVFGASNGGSIAQSLAYYHPKKVSKLALFGPMGLTQLTSGSIAMMGLATIYPFQFLRDEVADWALGTSPQCHSAYDRWFNSILKGTIPSIAQPVPMTTNQKQSMKLPILLFLGSKDKIVGDVINAKQTAMEYPNIQIEVLESGHLIAVEKSKIVNEKIQSFLD